MLGNNLYIPYLLTEQTKTQILDSALTRPHFLDFLSGSRLNEEFVESYAAVFIRKNTEGLEKQKILWYTYQKVNTMQEVISNSN